jgi:hypothetical protein
MTARGFIVPTKRVLGPTVPERLGPSEGENLAAAKADKYEFFGLVLRRSFGL